MLSNTESLRNVRATKLETHPCTSSEVVPFKYNNEESNEEEGEVTATFNPTSSSARIITTNSVGRL